MKFLKTHTGAMVVLAVAIVLSVLLGSPRQESRAQQGRRKLSSHASRSSHRKVSAGRTKVSVPSTLAGKPPSTRSL